MNEQQKPKKQQQQQNETKQQNKLQEKTKQERKHQSKTPEKQEPAQKSTPKNKTAAKGKGKIVKNVTDLKSFLSKKKLERAQKMKNESSFLSEGQSSHASRDYHPSANQNTSSGESFRRDNPLPEGDYTQRCQGDDN